MTQFTVKTAESSYLDNPELTKELARLCAAPTGVDVGIFGLVMDVRFEHIECLPEFTPPTNIVMRTSPGNIRNTPWYYVAGEPAIAGQLQTLAASFSLVVGHQDISLHDLLWEMHDASPHANNSYSILLGNGCGYLRRQNLSEDDGLMHPEVHRTDDDIQRYIDSQCRVLVPASGSNHARLAAAKRGAALGAIAYTLHHPVTHELIIPAPSLSRAETA